MYNNNSVMVWLFLALLFIGNTESKYIGAYFFSGGGSVNKPSADLNAKLVTHLYYAFLNLNDDGTLTIESESRGYVDDLLKLKTANPSLKLLFSVANQNGSFSKVAADANLRKNFVQNAINLITKHKYDGVDLDWEFPQNKDKENFVHLLEELHSEFKNHNYIVTAAVRAIPVYSDTGYIVPEMNKYLDIINVMTYDYFGSWSETTGQNSPLYPSSLDSDFEKHTLNINASVNNWIRAGASKNKIAIGIPFYGRTFNLTDPSKHGVHAPSNGGGKPAAVTYYQILRSYQNYTTVWNEEQKSPYKYYDTTWLAYDDTKSVNIKAKYASQNGLYGAFVWQIGGDDVYGEFSETEQPLLKEINNVLG